MENGESSDHPAINLRSPLSLKNSLRFPLQNPTARGELIIGALWLCVPLIGWLLNMGHRIRFVHNMHRGRPPFPAWSDYPAMLRHGALTFLGMAWYGAPGVSLMLAGIYWESVILESVGFLLWVAAVIAIPGYMSHYCRRFDPKEIFDPFRALSRVAEGGRAYWKAWGIVCVGLALSFLGLLVFGLGFLVTSVWFWQAAGFSFATVFTQKFQLDENN